MGPSEIESILQVGGPAALLVIVLISAVMMLWRYVNSLHEKVETCHERSVELAQKAVGAVERSTLTLDTLSRTEEQRGRQVLDAFNRVIDQTASLERLISTLNNEMGKQSGLNEDMRGMIRDLSHQLQTSLETMIAMMSQNRDTGRAMVAEIVSEINRTRELLLKRGSRDD